MPRWEVCSVQLESPKKDRSKYIAVAHTAQGRLVVDGTPDFHKEHHWTIGEEERSKLIGRMLAQGWEPISFNDGGNVTAFRRYIP